MQAAKIDSLWHSISLRNSLDTTVASGISDIAPGIQAGFSNHQVREGKFAKTNPPGWIGRRSGGERLKDLNLPNEAK